MLSDSGPASARPRVYRLAQDLIQNSQGSLNESAIIAYLQESQIKEPLRIAELWSFPLFLRMAIIEHLADLATSVACSQRCREAAQLWADRLTAAARRGNDEFNRMLARMESEDYVRAPHFLMVLAEQLQGEENTFASVQHWIEERLKQPLTEVVRAEHAREAAESVATAQAFGSLRLLAQFDFTTIFEAVSVVETELRLDPTGIYIRSDFATRDRCRRIVERIARTSAKEEIEDRTRCHRHCESRGRSVSSACYSLSAGRGRLAVGARRRSASGACKPGFTARFVNTPPAYTWAASPR